MYGIWNMAEWWGNNVTVDDDKWYGLDNLHIFLTQSEDKQETIITQQNSYSISMISHLLGTVTA